MQKIRSRLEIRQALKTHQKRLRLGEKLKPLIQLAEEAGLHRDTLYAAINGERISEISQIRLSRMLDRLAEEPRAPSRLMNISFDRDGLKLGFGIAQKDLLRPR